MAKTINLENVLRPWQKHYIQNKKRFNVIVVHRRWWKTVSSVIDCLVVWLQEKWDYWYIAPTYKQAKKIAWRMIQKFGDQIGWFQYNSSELIVSFENGSTLSLFGAEQPDSLRGLDLKGVIFDEYAQQPSNIYWEIVFPMINANKGWVTWIGTPKGKNSFYKLYERAVKDERFYTALLKYSDTNLLDEEQIADAREEMTEEEFEQEYNCSWNASMRGSVYGKELAQAFKDERVKKDIYNPKLKVTTFWDLGISDAMSIGFIQTLGNEVRIIDRYSNTGYWFEHYTDVLKKKEEELGYKYETHYFPHDIQHRELSTGTSRLETVIKLLWPICKVVPISTIESGISAGRLIFKYLWINEELEEFINNLSLYQYEWDDKLGQFKKEPRHDFTSHDADWFRYMANIYYHLIKDKMPENVVQEEIIMHPYLYKKEETVIELEINDNPY